MDSEALEAARPSSLIKGLSTQPLRHRLQKEIATPWLWKFFSISLLIDFFPATRPPRGATFKPTTPTHPPRVTLMRRLSSTNLRTIPLLLALGLSACAEEQSISELTDKAMKSEVEQGIADQRLADQPS